MEHAHVVRRTVSLALSSRWGLPQPHGCRNFLWPYGRMGPPELFQVTPSLWESLTDLAWSPLQPVLLSMQTGLWGVRSLDGELVEESFVAGGLSRYGFDPAACVLFEHELALEDETVVGRP